MLFNSQKWFCVVPIRCLFKIRIEFVVALIIRLFKERRLNDLKPGFVRSKLVIWLYYNHCRQCVRDFDCGAAASDVRTWWCVFWAFHFVCSLIKLGNFASGCISLIALWITQSYSLSCKIERNLIDVEWRPLMVTLRWPQALWGSCLASVSMCQMEADRFLTLMIDCGEITTANRWTAVSSRIIITRDSR